MLEKTKWLRRLKVGDVVNDCRGLNVTIKEVYPDYGPIMKNPINWFILNWLNRHEFCLGFVDKYDALMRTRSIPLFNAIWDMHLVMEDGSACSAFYCCSKAR